MMSSSRWITVVLAASLVMAACGGDDDSTRVANEVAGNPADRSGDAATDEGDGDEGAFHRGRAGWENACTVLTEDEVAAATGFVVLGSAEAGGCDWTIERIDDGIIAGEDSVIGWKPMDVDQFDAQRKGAPLAGSDITIEPIEGLGIEAFWQGTEGSDHGVVWVKLEELTFQVHNAFATYQYEGDTRAPMEGLAAALAAALS